MPVVSDPCSCQRDCLVCGRGKEPPHDCAIHVVLESMVFQERMLHGEPSEARLEEILLMFYQESSCGSKFPLPHQIIHWLLWLEKDGKLYFRLVDVGVYSVYPKVMNLLKIRQPQYSRQRRKVLAHKRDPGMPQRSKLVTPRRGL
ncbi:uncharacterized protein TNIN_75831 [Trichonephila inaurata madagascariensis]|uniref:Uncharacterized protein n=1 Tax=Trichonephila inaurata madagascariensis TaxID=2747483 RepID=A0A8X6JSS7_9ARAC|nr:uncharacterized protein TNIN_75831 [Trichonephila inaurata madagascariensis]